MYWQPGTPWPMLDSVRVRLTLWYVGVLALLLIGFSVAVYTVMSSILYGRVDAVLSPVVGGTVPMLAKESDEPGGVVFAPRHALKALSFPDTSLAIFTPEGRLIAEKSVGDYRSKPPPDIALLALNEVRKYTTRAKSANSGMYREAATKINIPVVHKTYVIVASQSLEPVLRQLDTLRRVFYIALPAVLLLAGFGGWFLARKSLAPVVAMSEQARRIGAENLDERLTIANPRDELGRLASTLNELLSRVSAAFSRQRQFIADASHELRTPVSVIQTATAVALDREHRQEDEYRGVLGMIDGQVRRLSRIVENLFRLTRADSGQYILNPHDLYLDELLTETARAATLLAAPKGISVEIPDLREAPYFGDEDMLRQMISNLLDNAIKYTPPGGRIGLALEAHQENYAISVFDSGPGIPVEAQAHIFERFFRADKSRSGRENSGDGGAGLGLSIARWVAEAHQGRLSLQCSDERGSTFVAVLPVSVESLQAAQGQQASSA
jgi:two-component system OmpR family sensor kinase